MQYTRIALRPGLRIAGTRCKSCTHCKDPLQGMDPLQRSDLLQGTFAGEFDQASIAARIGPAARHRPAATGGLTAKHIIFSSFMTLPSDSGPNLLLPSD